jgi:predicted helicase
VGRTLHIPRFINLWWLNKEGKAATGEGEGVVFKLYSGGVKTNCDAWAYHFNPEILADQMQRTIEFYNQEVFRWSRRRDKPHYGQFRDGESGEEFIGIYAIINP